MTFATINATMSICDDLFDPIPINPQARRIIDRFGGVASLTKALNAAGYKITRFSVYKWCYRKSRSGHGGSGGLIPAASKPWVKKAARMQGIDLTMRDWAS